LTGASVSNTEAAAIRGGFIRNHWEFV
jgi:hypothetical protein